MNEHGTGGWTERWRRRLVAAPGILLRRGIGAYNRLVGAVARPGDVPGPQDEREILHRARVLTDISHHLPTLFAMALAAEPRLVVELGIRGGDSTFVFSRVARRLGATLVSVDIDDCSDVCDDPDWIFVQEDDLALARRFPEWCARRGLPSAVDVLFVDTTHAYEQTRAELDAWMPHLAPSGRAIFHDSNMGGLYRRGDGTLGLAPSNERGVIRALHEHLGAPFDERRPFAGPLGAHHVWHDPLCNGLTVISRTPL